MSSIHWGKSQETWSFDKQKATSSQNQALDLLLSKLGSQAVQEFEEAAVTDFFPGYTRNCKALEQAGKRRMKNSFPTAAGEMGQVSSSRPYGLSLLGFLLWSFLMWGRTVVWVGLGLVWFGGLFFFFFLFLS